MSLGGRRKPPTAHLVGRPVAVRQHGGKALDSARDLVSQNRMCHPGLSRSWDTKFGRITFSRAGYRPSRPRQPPGQSLVSWVGNDWWRQPGRASREQAYVLWDTRELDHSRRFCHDWYPNPGLVPAETVREAGYRGGCSECGGACRYDHAVLEHVPGAGWLPPHACAVMAGSARAPVPRIGLGARGPTRFGLEPALATAHLLADAQWVP